MKIKFDKGLSKFPLIDEGEYVMGIVYADVKMSSSENPMIEAGFKILSDEAHPVDGKEKGLVIPHTWSLVEKAQWRLRQDMFNLDLVEDGEELEDHEVCERLVGTKCLATVETNPNPDMPWSIITAVQPYEEKPKRAAPKRVPERRKELPF